MRTARAILAALVTAVVLATGLAAPTPARAAGVAPVARVSCAIAEQVSAAWGKPVRLVGASPTHCRYAEVADPTRTFAVDVKLGTPAQEKARIAAGWPEGYPYPFSPYPVPELGPDAFAWADASPTMYYWTITPGVVASLVGDTWEPKPSIAVAKLFRPMLEVYTVDGERTVNGRQWRTTCENYSATARCFTQIWGTTVKLEGGRYVRTDGWVFNSLTYRWAPRELWAGNPLAMEGEWTAADGRQWRTQCDTTTTGRGACRSEVRSTVVSWTGSGYRQETKWVFNNMVLFYK